MNTSGKTKSVLVLLLTAGSVVMVAGRVVNANFTLGTPTRVGPVIDNGDTIDCLSYDGLEMYIASSRLGGLGGADMWVLKRASKDDAWGPAENLGPSVNSPKDDGSSSISADGLTLYFDSDRPGGYGDYDVYMTTRATKNDPWGPPVNLGPKVNTPVSDAFAWISPDDRELYLGSNRSGGYGGIDIYMTRRATQNDPWGEPVNLGPVVNSAYGEQWCSLSPDKRLLLFCDFSSKHRPGGYGSADMWMTRRASLSDPWQAPVNLGPQVNGASNDVYPRVSPDGRTLYFLSDRSGSYESWQAPIVPVVDFNGDGKVDLVDLVMLIDNWGSSKTLCDIGPMPWGDGKVDIEDLKVFMTYYEKENPPVKP